MDLSSTDNGLTGKGLLFVISSVSGGGKTTVIRGLMELMDDLELSVSHTTREPRPGELDGIDYTFIDDREFESMIDEGLFLEWALVYGHYYGTSRSTVEAITDNGRDAVLDIDVQGGMQVKEKRKDAIMIFIVVPGEEEQERRLRSRGTESDHEVSMRLEAARRELAFINEYHYSVLNDKVRDAVDAVSSIIRAERCRNRNNFNV
jgi:guanylate kinase